MKTIEQILVRDFTLFNEIGNLFLSYLHELMKAASERWLQSLRQVILSNGK